MTDHEQDPGSGWETDPARVLIARAQTGDERAREALILQNDRLVRSVVNRFYASGKELEDLYQLGVMGLLKAVDRFNLELPVRFSTYAVPMFLGEIRRYLRDDGPVRVSRSVKTLATQVRKTQERLLKSMEREPSLAEIAQAMGEPLEAVVEALESVRPLASLHEPIYSGDGDPIYLHEQLATDDGERIWLERVALQEGLDHLNRREREILLLRYFRDKTQTEVARLLGISQVQVSRLERRALNQIRQYLTGTDD